MGSRVPSLRRSRDAAFAKLGARALVDLLPAGRRDIAPAHLARQELASRIAEHSGRGLVRVDEGALEIRDPDEDDSRVPEATKSRLARVEQVIFAAEKLLAGVQEGCLRALAL